jgi:hypothetical protein
MSLDALKNEAANLDEESRRELVRFLISLREGERRDWARRVTEVRDSEDEARWLTGEEFRERLERIPEPTDDSERE